MRSKYQRRHYKQIAGLIADLRTDALDRGDLFMLETVDVFRDRLVETFRRDNPRFSSDRFVSACETSVSTT
jgi:hypothetical protein